MERLESIGRYDEMGVFEHEVHMFEMASLIGKIWLMETKHEDNHQCGYIFRPLIYVNPGWLILVVNSQTIVQTATEMVSPPVIKSPTIGLSMRLESDPGLRFNGGTC